MTIAELTEKIIQEDYRITRENLDKELLLRADLEEMLDCAGKLQKHFCGNLVDFCSIINGRSGRCSEDCKYCAQAACNHTGPATIPALTNTVFCRKTRSLRLQKQTRTQA